jgi:hypothetical protein
MRTVLRVVENAQRDPAGKRRSFAPEAMLRVAENFRNHRLRAGKPVAESAGERDELQAPEPKMAGALT